VTQQDTDFFLIQIRLPGIGRCFAWLGGVEDKLLLDNCGEIICADSKADLLRILPLKYREKEWHQTMLDFREIGKFVQEYNEKFEDIPYEAILDLWNLSKDVFASEVSDSELLHRTLEKNSSLYDHLFRISEAKTSDAKASVAATLSEQDFSKLNSIARQCLRLLERKLSINKNNICR